MARPCKTCNKSYTKTAKSTYKQFAKSKYCSIDCRRVAQKLSMKGSSNPNYKGGVSNCTDCNKQLAARFATNKRCRPCWNKYNVGENNAQYTGKYVIKNGHSVSSCINCDAACGDTKSVLCKNCRKGAFHHAWKGGVSSLQSSIRVLPENRQWVKQVMYRDNYTCMDCGWDKSVKGTNKRLEVDHIKQFALILKEHNISSIEEAKQCEELWNIDNGRALCNECHKLTSTYNKRVYG